VHWTLSLRLLGRDVSFDADECCDAEYVTTNYKLMGCGTSRRMYSIPAKHPPLWLNCLRGQDFHRQHQRFRYHENVDTADLHMSFLLGFKWQSLCRGRASFAVPLTFYPKCLHGYVTPVMAFDILLISEHPPAPSLLGDISSH
jgi:hypothetical protein